MKIGLFFSSLGYPSGGARLLSTFAEMIEELGNEPVILTNEFSPSILKSFSSLRKHKILLIGSYPKIKMSWGSINEINLTKPRDLVQHIKDEKISCLILFSGYYLTYLLKLLVPSLQVILYLFFPYSCAYSISSKEAFGRISLRRMLLKKYESVVYKKADLVLTISLFSQRTINRVLKINSEILYEPIDTKFFKPDWPKKRRDVIISVSQFVPGKKFENMIRWFKEIAGDYKLLLAGGVNPHHLSYLSYLKKLAKSDNRIKFILNPTDTRLKKLYQVATLYWHVREEHHILTPLEAMACGTPSVLIGRGGLDGAEHGYNSFVVKDKNEFLEYTKKLLSDEDLWRTMARNAFTSIQQFSMESAKIKLKKYFNRLREF